MVWYIPPLSPVVDVLRDTGHDAEAAGNLFGAIDALRIPLSYLAGLFTAGDTGRVRDVLARLAAMRSFMRDVNLGREPDLAIPAAVGMSPEGVEDMYRLLALAKYDERYVIPPAHAELGDAGLGDVPAQAHQLEELACSLDYDDGRGMGGSGPFGESSGGPPPVAVENFHALRQRQTSDTFVDPADGAERVNLLNWDGKGGAARLMPHRRGPAEPGPDGDP
jgi:nitrate reductase beta subunit